MLIGFTGATGGFNDIHRVQNVTITTGPPPPAPTVTGISPTSGPTTGGTAVTITGTNFTGASAVKFGTKARDDVHGQQRHADHGDRPAGQRGTVDVTVTTPAGV